ncbi:hypothetical protein KIMH_10200 [Bombiscardovia apis]|uniref:ABC transporter permease n=1 Tax=Bombiscardovia apis TaxID=2932182 RepID=A0ABM8BDC5_9BIFI|nr:hypothetical protein [Bombiscardovia apis]BDR54909.1 hypothetical protein KIMH_10200 [Bombiscardovia apis]
MKWNVFTAEIKAILRPRPTLITAVLALGFIGLLSSLIGATMQPSTAPVIAQYGPTATPALISGSEAHNAELERKFQADLAQLQPQASKEGVNDYRSARSFIDKIQEQIWQDASVADGPTGQLYDQIEGLNSYQQLLVGHRVVDNYRGCGKQGLAQRAASQLGLLSASEHSDLYQYLGDASAASSKRVELPKAVDQRVNALAQECQSGMGLTHPDDTIQLSQSYLRMVFLVVLLATLGLCAPLLTRNRMRRMRQTQWSTRVGRSIQGIEMAAAATVAFLVAAVSYALALALWLPKIKAYLPTPVFDGADLPWFNWSVGTYIAVFLAASFALNLGCALLMVWFSSHMSTYISLLLVLVPFAVIAFFVEAQWLMVGPFIIGNEINRLLPLVGIEGYICLAVLALGAALCIVGSRKVKHQQLATA